MISWLNLGFNFFTNFFGDAFAPLGNANAPPIGARLCHRPDCLEKIKITRKFSKCQNTCEGKIKFNSKSISWSLKPKYAIKIAVYREAAMVTLPKKLCALLTCS